MPLVNTLRRASTGPVEMSLNNVPAHMTQMPMMRAMSAVHSWSL